MNRKPVSMFPLTLLLTVLIASAPCSLLCAADNESYRSITGPCNHQFPQDHGPHPGYRTEWWYYTGNLRSETGERFGFQLTFFRSQISPSGEETTWPNPASAWRSQQIFVAHAALSDIEGKHFFHAEDVGREALGIAGARQDGQTTTIHLKNWSARLTPEEHQLNALTDDFSLDLILHPLKEPVLHGNAGYSLKGSTPERSSCYYSFTRLETQGMLTYRDKTFAVRGSSWMDHEFSSAPLEPGLTGWDWFSLQLSDNTELMIYLLRQKDGNFSPASSGTFVDRSERTLHLSRADFKVDISDHWQSLQTQAQYPSRWRMRVPSIELDLTITPNLDDQELQSLETTRVTYWEGSVSVEGIHGGQAVEGVGYVELTGYEKVFDAPL